MLGPFSPLTGFWINKRAKPEEDRLSPASAAIEAFITTRVGDVGFLIGIMFLFRSTGTFDFRQLSIAVTHMNKTLLTVAMILVFGLGVAGPEYGPGPGMFHLFTHAFFKALLFLGADSVLHALHHAMHREVQDMRLMVGLEVPAVYVLRQHRHAGGYPAVLLQRRGPRGKYAMPLGGDDHWSMDCPFTTPHILTGNVSIPFIHLLPGRPAQAFPHASAPPGR